MDSALSCDTSFQDQYTKSDSIETEDCSGLCAEQNALEREYVLLYSELHTKLRRILYLNKFNSAAKCPRESVCHEAETAEKALALVTTDCATFLRHQSSIVIDQTLLGNFLQLSTPVSRAVHCNSNDLAASEKNINHILTQLYSIDSIDGYPRGDAFRLMRALENLMPAIDSAALHTELVRANSSREMDSLREKERQSRAELDAKHAEFKIEKCNAVREQRVFDVRSKYLNLTEQWALANKAATFLQLWVSSFPLNWYDDENLREIMDRCQDLSYIVDSFELVVSSRSVHEFSDEQLIMLDLAEIRS